ncbi:hypothetical protein GCM10027049_29440 [Mucilaginibacter puniceus]
MEEQKEQQQQPPSFIDQLKEYAETRIKLAKYQAVDGGSSIIASLVAQLIVIISLLLVFIFASLTLAFFLSEVLDSLWQGFGCAALIYLIIAVILNAKKPGIEKTIANRLIEKFLN